MYIYWSLWRYIETQLLAQDIRFETTVKLARQPSTTTCSASTTFHYSYISYGGKFHPWWHSLLTEGGVDVGETFKSSFLWTVASNRSPARQLVVLARQLVVPALQ